MSATQSVSHGRLHSCPNCGFATRHPNLLDRHMKHCSGSSSMTSSASNMLPAPSVCRNYKCGKCNFISNKAKLFLYHQRQVHGENIAVYGCNECEYASRHKNKVVRHKRLVHKVISSPEDILALEDHAQVNCSDVEMSGVPETVDMNEKQTSDSNEVNVKDEDLCVVKDGTWFPTNHAETGNQPSGLQDVVEASVSGLVEAGEKRIVEKEGGDRMASFLGKWILPKVNAVDGLYRCKFCRYSNPHKWKIASHMRTSHSRKTTYKCPQCSFVTERKIEWCTHKTLHSGKTIYSCNECAYQTTMKRNFERHQERHLVNGPRRCSLCSYSSTGEGAIQRHMAEYHPPSPGKPDPSFPEDGPMEEEDTDGKETTAATIPQSSAISSDLQSASTSQTPSMVPPLCSSAPPHCSSAPPYCSSAPPYFPVTMPPFAASSTFPSSGVDQSMTPNENKMSILPPVSSFSTGARLCDLTKSSKSVLSFRMVAPRLNESRWTCTLCPLGYKRAADLNRHMKRKHGVSLKDVKTTGPSLPGRSLLKGSSILSNGQILGGHSIMNSGPIMSNMIKSNSTIGLNLSSRSNVNSSPASLSFEDQPLNLSVKKNSGSCDDSVEQGEVLDLSTKTRPGAFGIAEVTPHFRCDSCSYTTKKFNELERHSLIHSCEKKYRCTLCGKGYDVKLDLTKHMTSEHKLCIVSDSPVQRFGEGTGKGVGISLGTQNSSSKSIVSTKVAGLPDVQRNVKSSTLHTAETGSRSQVPSIKCVYCQYVSKYPAEMAHHMKMHVTEKLHGCQFCDYKTTWKSDMKFHVMNQHVEEAKKIGNVQEFIDLNYQQSEEKDKQSFSKSNDEDDDYVDYNMNVEMSDGGFMQEMVEAAAYSTQTGMRRCPFPQCKFVCETSSKMKSHMEVHDGLKRFMCVHCGKRSSWLWDIRKHIRRRHPGVDMTIRELSEEEARTLPVTEFDSSPTEELVKAELSGKDDTKDGTPKEKLSLTDEELKSLPKEEPVDVEKLAEQYANEVAAMFYGASSASSADSSVSSVPQLWVETKGTGSSGQNMTIKKYGRPSKSLLMNRFRPFKCSECGRRSNWRWDLNKHIRATHPNAQLIELTEVEAKATFHEVLHRDIRERRQMMQMEGNGGSKFKPYMCDACGHRSNWKCDMNKHIKALHPSAQIITLDEEQAKKTIAEYDAQNAKMLKQETSSSAAEDVSAETTMEKYLIPAASTCVTVDNHKLKRFKCSACPYRSNFRSDVGRHIRHKHDKGVSRIIVMNENEAAETLREYMETWARKKFVSSPSKKRSGIDRRRLGQQYGMTSLIGGYHGLKETAQMENVDKDLICAECGFKCPTERAMAEHWQQQHGKDIAHIIPNSGGVLLDAAGKTIERSTCGSSVADQNSAKDMSARSMDGSPRRKLEHSTGSSIKTLCCSICPYQTSKTGLLNIHKTYHRPNGRNKHKCRYCPYYVCASRLLNQHIRLHLRENDGSVAGVKTSEAVEVAGEEGGEDLGGLSCQESATRTLGRTTYCCLKCPYVSSNRNDYLYHRQFHRPRNTPAFKCDLCPYWVSQKRLLAQHAKVHGEEYTSRHTTSGSRQGNSGNETLQENKHRNLVNTEFDQTEGRKEDAMSGKNEDENDVAMLQDDSKESLAMLQNELSDFQMGGKFHCRSCPFSTENQSSFEDHLSQHGSRQKFACPSCSFSANSLTQLRQHKKVHECKYAISDKATRTQKADDTCESHYNESKKIYCCDRCPYSNARRDHLMCHMKFHQIKSDLQCPHCDYSVSRVHLLNQHLKVHGSVSHSTPPPTPGKEPICSSRQRRAKNRTDDPLPTESHTSFVVWMNQKQKSSVADESARQLTCSSSDASRVELTKSKDEEQLKCVFMHNLRLRSSNYDVERGNRPLSEKNASSSNMTLLHSASHRNQCVETSGTSRIC